VPPAGQTSQPTHKTQARPFGADLAGGRPRRLPWAPWSRARWLLALGLVVFGGILGTYIADLANHISIMAAMRDLVVYNQGGLITRKVSPPYNSAQSAPLYSWHGRHRVSFTYTPIAAIIFAAGSMLSWLTLRWVMTIISLAALLLSVWLMFGALGYPSRQVRAGATLLAAGAALAIEPVQQTLALGQINLLLMLLVVMDLLLARRWWSGAGIGLAAGIKLVPLIFIPYLLLTGRYRQAAVALGTFAATIGIGYAVLPRDSARYWWDGVFLNANRITFLGTRGNQSLRALLTRFLGSVNGSGGAWVAVAVTVAIVGLVTAAALYRAGHPVPGLLACAAGGLLVSPLSWDHHWVWVTLGLGYLGHLAARARGRVRAAWWVAAAALLGVFVAVPQFWSRKAALTPAGWIWYSPTRYFAYGDNPAFNEYHWNVLQTMAGDSYVLAGLLALLALAAAAIRFRRPLIQFVPSLARRPRKVPLWP
jgi:alpha-1,2-mannosyltransferase